MLHLLHADRGRPVDGRNAGLPLHSYHRRAAADPASEEVVITFPGGGHNGGDLHFGNDGMLYISTGDGAGPNPPDRWNTGQDISDLLSSVLRIDVNRKDDGKTTRFPRQSFRRHAGQPPGEIWAYHGFRNPGE